MIRIRRFIKGLGLFTLAFTVLFLVVYLFLPKGPRQLVPYQDQMKKPRTLFTGESYAVVTGTPWATQAALEILDRDGNAYDAAAAALLVLNVTHGEAASFPGVAPVMIYDAATGDVRSYIGAGKAPAAATIERFQARGWKTVPEMNIWSQLIPASPDVLVALLRDYGTLSFTEVAAPAVAIAREGFPAHGVIVKNLDFSLVERLGFTVLMPYNAEVFIQKEWWRPVHLHERMRFPDLAATFEKLAEVEQAAIRAGGSRESGLEAVREEFYQGSIAEAILAFHDEAGGLFSREDLAGYTGGWEEPVTGSFGNYTLYTNGTWSQGAIAPLTLQILEGIDLEVLGHNSPAYIHTVNQAIELAMADRDAYLGDPAFVDVPLDILMSKDYAAQRREMMTPHAFGPLPPPGSIAGQAGWLPGKSSGPAAMTPPDLASGFDFGQDTTQLVIRDRWGNAVVITPSDFPQTPMVPETGLNLGNRMNQFRLDSASPNALAPGKRPRITPHAIIVFKDGEFYMAYSTPGGDMQSQALVQVFLNMHVFGMDVQQAISAPRFYSLTAPSSFAPHEASPATLRLEADLYESRAAGLEALGYMTKRDAAWDNDFGAVGAILVGPDGKLSAGADPREETWAGGK